VVARAVEMVQEDKQTRMEAAAQRVKQLEAAADEAHRQAQELNKQGRSVATASCSRGGATNKQMQQDPCKCCGSVTHILAVLVSSTIFCP
jgi:hypothetical protein